VNGSTQTVSLTGTGVSVTTLSLTPTSLSFGDQGLGATSAAKAVTVKNTGTGQLTFSNIAITGTDSGDFAKTSTCTGSIAPGGSCAVNVTFTPTAAGARSAVLTLADDAQNGGQTVSLTGTGVAPVVLSPTSLAFATQPIATSSAAKNVTLTSNLSSALTISSITFTGADPGDFAETDTCNGSVPAKGKCTISVTFTPQATGSRAATMNVNDSANTSPQTVSLTGSGVVQVALSPTSLTFAAQTVGTKSAAESVTLTNNLATALTVGSITFTGADPGDFAETDNCVGSVPAKGKCTISVTFKPTATGTRTATMDVNDSANNSPQTVSLTGTGK
jgi:FlaG/FlaF family flagellin (archaellin)